MPWAPFRPAGHPHLQDDAHDWQVQGLPRHRGRPLVNLTAHWSPGGQGQEPVLWKRPAKATESHSWTMRPSGCPSGHSPASRQGASLSKYSGAMRLSSAWNSRVKGRRDTSTRDCGPTAGRGHQPRGRLQGPGPGSSRVTQGRALHQLTGQLSHDGPLRTPGPLAGKPQPPPDGTGNPDDTWVGLDPGPSEEMHVAKVSLGV